MTYTCKTPIKDLSGKEICKCKSRGYGSMIVSIGKSEHQKGAVDDDSIIITSKAAMELFAIRGEVILPRYLYACIRESNMCFYESKYIGDIEDNSEMIDMMDCDEPDVSDYKLLLKIPLTKMYVLALIFAKYDHVINVYDSPIHYYDKSTDYDGYDDGIMPRPIYKHTSYYADEIDEDDELAKYFNPKTAILLQQTVFDTRDILLYKKRLPEWSNDIRVIFCDYETIFSEEYIDKHKDELDWTMVCRTQKMSETFMEEHKDYLDWEAISKYQRLTKQFIEKHMDLLSMKWIIRRYIETEA
jgi:hypothetical protein